MAGGCHAHPLRPARFRCEGCERLLCEACVDEGHRLLLCTVCGERALPLASEGPATVRQRHEARLETANVAYGWGDLLRYCFRGEGRWIFWITVAIFAVFQFFVLAASVAPMRSKFLPLAIAFLLLVFLLWIVPSQLVRIARTTYHGSNELPSWAPAHDFPERSREILALLFAVLVGMAPSLLALRLLGCRPGADGESVACALAWIATLPAMVALGSLGFTAFAEFGAFWVVARLDLHVRFLATVGRDAWATAGAIVLGVALAVFVVAAVGGVPLMLITPYTLYTSAHACGVLFRRHRGVVERLYSPAGSLP